MQDTELWMPIPSLNGFYEASTLGRIRSVNRISILGAYLRPIKGKIIKATCHPKTGYYYISICIDGLIGTRLVHRLIAETWIPNPENKPHVNHKKGIKTDNRVSELEWVTISENRLHSFKTGLQTARGVKNSQVKLSELDVQQIRESNDRNGVIANQFNISPSTVCDIKSRRSWSHL